MTILMSKMTSSFFYHVHKGYLSKTIIGMYCIFMFPGFSVRDLNASIRAFTLALDEKMNGGRHIRKTNTWNPVPLVNTPYKMDNNTAESSKFSTTSP